MPVLGLSVGLALHYAREPWVRDRSRWLQQFAGLRIPPGQGAGVGAAAVNTEYVLRATPDILKALGNVTGNLGLTTMLSRPARPGRA